MHNLYYRGQRRVDNSFHKDRVSKVLAINYSTQILFTDLGCQRMKGYTVWSKHILTRMRNAGSRHCFLTLKIYK